MLQHLKGAEGEGEGALGKAVVMCLVAASAALVTNEQFASQTRYLQLKFDERIVLNPSANSTSSKLSVGGKKPSFTALQGTSVFDKHQHLMAIVMQAFTQHFRSAAVTTQTDTLCYHSVWFLGSPVVEGGSSLQNRLLFFRQMHDMLSVMHAEDFDIYAVADLVIEEYLGSLTWLLPVEIVYLHQLSDPHVIQEGVHSQLLQLADKGMLLFSEKYLAGQETDIYTQWADLIGSIVVQDMVNKEAALLKQCLLCPPSRITMQYEQNILTGSKQLRLGVQLSSSNKKKAATTEFNSMQQLATQMIWGSIKTPALTNNKSSHEVNGSGGGSNGTTSEGNHMMRRLRQRVNKVRTQVEKLTNSWKVYEMPAKVEKLAGDMMVLWLLLRGRALQCLGRVWEAIFMYKMVVTMQRYAPRSRFASFIAYFHIAEILMNYDILSPYEHSNIKVVRSIEDALFVLTISTQCA
ncbi:hypothetical protein EON65_24225 [archaeon]|nr:MAG: hypothetical protein EON65_24225 [archaeon]